MLLATPLMRSFRRAWPGAAIDALVFRGTEGILAANPDLRTVHTVPERPTLGQQAALLRAIWRRYDLAASVLPGDRPTLYAFAAGRRRIGCLVNDADNRWKQRLLHQWVPFDNLAEGMGQLPRGRSRAPVGAPRPRRAACARRRAGDRLVARQVRAELDFVVKRPRGALDVFECKVNPDNFDPEALKVFRSLYPKGRNFVTGPWIEIPYIRRYGDLAVTCGTPAGLLGAEEPTHPRARARSGRSRRAAGRS